MIKLKKTKKVEIYTRGDIQKIITFIGKRLEEIESHTPDDPRLAWRMAWQQMCEVLCDEEYWEQALYED